MGEKFQIVAGENVNPGKRSLLQCQLHVHGTVNRIDRVCRDFPEPLGDVEALRVLHRRKRVKPDRAVAGFACPLDGFLHERAAHPVAASAGRT